MPLAVGDADGLVGQEHIGAGLLHQILHVDVHVVALLRDRARACRLLSSSPNSGLFQRSQFHTPIWSGVNHSVAKLGSGCMEKRAMWSWMFFQASPAFWSPRLQIGAGIVLLDGDVDADLGELRLDGLGSAHPLGFVEDIKGAFEAIVESRLSSEARAPWPDHSRKAPSRDGRVSPAR